MSVNLPPILNKPRIVLIGGGFAGIELVKDLKDVDAQIVLIDRYNFHTFQPLLYQVATAALEPNTVACSFRQIFKKQKNFVFRMGEIKSVIPERNCIETSLGCITYDYLVIAAGAKTNYFGMKDIESNVIPMHTVSEAIALRQLILSNFEKALLTEDIKQKDSLMNVVIAGGGPTGVEIAGACGELKNHILPLDYPELDFQRMQIHIIDMEDRLLRALSVESSRNAEEALKKLNINIWLKTKVNSYDGNLVSLSNGKQLMARTMIWSAGVTATVIPGLESALIKPSNRLTVDAYSKVQGYNNIFAVGDIAGMISEEYPKGYPMLAPVAIQQAKNLAQNFKRLFKQKTLQPFIYKDYGVMATIGRHQAVVESGFLRLHGPLAWFIWLFFHLMTLVGFRNKMIAFVNWFWSYLTYDRSVRLIIPSFKR